MNLEVTEMNLEGSGSHGSAHSFYILPHSFYILPTVLKLFLYHNPNPQIHPYFIISTHPILHSTLSNFNNFNHNFFKSILQWARSSTPRNTSMILSTPSAGELDEFFSKAERYDHKRFAEKYNYDIVKDSAN